ncbi:elongation factor P 5-aminopentanone reductase [Jeotgalibaca caeni]|uniref:elongation factor P 5-aminopentanone reductase n=1 Tax=Jeotgalibaca caeni TaxID=3028623 RepID=UPI00237DAD6C|nr:SDR family oxidoreductase [Jeotgalibaca caeni]MDE1548956.1 SDR family oxidoreductase [Jeotgalibaca caeni]
MKIALITGASGDIGANIARRLASNGWSLYLHYHTNRAKIDVLLEEFEEQYPKQEFYPIHVDLVQENAAEQMKGQIFSLTAIVFAHGTTEYGLLQDLEPEKMDLLWNMHVKTPVLITQAFQNKLHQQENGRIVFISSVYGEMGSSNEVFYSTVKGAQLAFVKAYSKEVASLGITVNAISPGAISTQMNNEFDEEDLLQLSAAIPLGRLGTTDEVSFWVEQLLQPESRYMTGQSLTVSGGWLK